MVSSAVAQISNLDPVARRDDFDYTRDISLHLSLPWCSRDEKSAEAKNLVINGLFFLISKTNKQDRKCKLGSDLLWMH